MSGAAAGAWGFHAEGVGRGRTAEQNRSDTERRVREGRAHAALVYDGPTCVGWCQFGPTDELPRIKHRRAYEDGLSALPDWRITCFFRQAPPAPWRRGRRAHRCVLGEIARLGGGTVESYPEAVEGRSTSSSFPHHGTVSLFARHGFERVRRIGKHHWVVSTVVPTASG